MFETVTLFEYENEDEKNSLRRRVLVFRLIDNKVVLDLDCDECRHTKRHKWQKDRYCLWSRLNTRDNTLKSPRPISLKLRLDALQAMRNLIKLEDRLERQADE